MTTNGKPAQHWEGGEYSRTQDPVGCKYNHLKEKSIDPAHPLFPFAPQDGDHCWYCQDEESRELLYGHQNLSKPGELVHGAHRLCLKKWLSIKPCCPLDQLPLRDTLPFSLTERILACWNTYHSLPKDAVLVGNACLLGFLLHAYSFCPGDPTIHLGLGVLTIAVLNRSDWKTRLCAGAILCNFSLAWSLVKATGLFTSPHKPGFI